MSARRQLLGSHALDVLALLRDDPALTANDVSRDLGRAGRRVRHVLFVLVTRGLVERHLQPVWGRQHRPPWLYSISALGLRELARREAAGRVPGVPRTGGKSLPPIPRRRAA